jgi:hypothetical protein
MSHALSYGVMYQVYEGIYFQVSNFYTEYIPVYTFPQKYMTSYDGIGISGYMMVHDRHMSLYDEDSVVILVMATNVPCIRTLISGTCLLILPIFVSGCCRDWYMLAHTALLCSRLHPAGPPECGTFVAPERHARSSTNDFILSSGFNPFRRPPPPPF